MERPRSVMEVQADYQGRAFTAALTAHEFWLVLNKGFQPLGMVTGHCMYAIGSLTRLVGTAKGNFHGVVKEFSEFMHQTYAVALARMQFEADELGADGVIGVNVEVKYLHKNEWMQVSVTGTAVRYVGTGGKKWSSEKGQVVVASQGKRKERSMQRPQNVMDIQADYHGRAFTSNLSGEELWLMLEAGYEPLGVIISNGFSAMGQSPYWDMIFKMNFHTEIPRNFGMAKSVAFDSMFSQARKLGADTLIGVQYKTMFKYHNSGKWLECFIMGTALRYVGEDPGKPRQLKEPLVILEQGTSQPHRTRGRQRQKIWPCGHTNRPSAHFCRICGEVASIPVDR